MSSFSSSPPFEGPLDPRRLHEVVSLKNRTDRVYRAKERESERLRDVLKRWSDVLPVDDEGRRKRLDEIARTLRVLDERLASLAETKKRCDDLFAATMEGFYSDDLFDETTRLDGRTVRLRPLAWSTERLDVDVLVSVVDDDDVSSERLMVESARVRIRPSTSVLWRYLVVVARSSGCCPLFSFLYPHDVAIIEIGSTFDVRGVVDRVDHFREAEVAESLIPEEELLKEEEVVEMIVPESDISFVSS